MSEADYEAISGAGGTRRPSDGTRLVNAKRPGMELVVAAQKSVARPIRDPRPDPWFDLGPSRGPAGRLGARAGGAGGTQAVGDDVRVANHEPVELVGRQRHLTDLPLDVLHGAARETYEVGAMARPGRSEQLRFRRLAAGVAENGEAVQGFVHRFGEMVGISARAAAYTGGRGSRRVG